MTSFSRQRIRRVANSVRPMLECLEDRTVPTVFNVGAGDVNGLIADINAANGNGQPSNIINLAGGTYDLTAVNNYWYGPNALPPITSNLTINGNGATIERDGSSTTPAMRLFYVSGGLSGELPMGYLTMQDVTLQNGLAQGGNGSGGGMGAGGAIFNQGGLALDRVTLTNNRALGGSSGSGGGGGMGGNADNGDGGGFGGSLAGGPYGGKGGITTSANGGGGGSFLAGADGQANGSPGGVDGFGGGAGGDSSGGDGGAGGGFGVGGSTGAGGGDPGGGGGGVGGGGGTSGFGSGSIGYGGDGGFGGGGGYGVDGGGSGGFGGGGASGDLAGPGGFGGGAGGGGGGGFGGAIFNMGANNVAYSGSTTITDSTLTGNSAAGGNGANGGSGYGAAVFNFDGSVTLNDDTLAANTVAGGTGFPGTGSNGNAAGGAVYNLAFGNIIQTGTATNAVLTLHNSILADTTGGADLSGSVVNGHGTNSASINGSTNLVMSQNVAGTPLAAGVITTTANPNLGPLQNNGGLTPTMADAPGSAAYGAGNASLPGVPPVDQRGLSRLNSQGLDLGAYEYQTVANYSPPPPTPTPSLPANVELLFLAEDQFALSIDSLVSHFSSDPRFTQAADQLMNALNSRLGLDNSALGTGLAGLQSAIYDNPFYGTLWGNAAQAIGLNAAINLFAAPKSS